MSDPRSEVDTLEAENERLTKERDDARDERDDWRLRFSARPSVAAFASLEARLNEAMEALGYYADPKNWEYGFAGVPVSGDGGGVARAALASLPDSEGGEALVGPAVCYACPMFEGAAHMPNAANHRPDPEGATSE